jgi:DNA-binding MarR family transcriptional regulator
VTGLDPISAFMVSLKRIDTAHLTTRDVLIMWAIKTAPGLMGRELATKLGYRSRSNVQENIGRLIVRQMIEDRRPVHDNKTPNDLHLTPAGEAFLQEITTH